MRRFKLFAALAVSAFFILIPVTALRAAKVEKVVAVVNERIITLSELQQEIGDLTVKPENPVDPQDALQAMVDRILIEQQAAARRISVSDEEVKMIAESQREAMGLDKESLAKELENQNISEKLFYRQWKHQILSGRLIESITQGSVAVTDKEVEEYYRRYYGAEKAETEIPAKQTKIAHILILKETENALATADEILEEVKSGKSFAWLAGRYSMDKTTAPKGGVLGYFVKGDLVPEIERAVEQTEVNGIAGPVETSQGYHILKVLDRIEETSSVVRYKENIRQQIYREKVEEFISNWLQEIKEKSYIETKL